MIRYIAAALTLLIGQTAAASSALMTFRGTGTMPIDQFNGQPVGDDPINIEFSHVRINYIFEDNPFPDTMGEVWFSYGITGPVKLKASWGSQAWEKLIPISQLGQILFYPEPTRGMPLVNWWTVLNTDQSVTNNAGITLSLVQDGIYVYTPAHSVVFGAGLGSYFSLAEISAIPEPSTWMLLSLSLGLLGATSRMRQMRAIAASSMPLRCATKM